MSGRSPSSTPGCPDPAHPRPAARGSRCPPPSSGRPRGAARDARAGGWGPGPGPGRGRGRKPRPKFGESFQALGTGPAAAVPGVLPVFTATEGKVPRAGGGGAEMKWVGDSARPRLPRPASGRPRLRFPSRRHPQICRCRDPRWLRGRVPGWGHRCCRARGCFVFCFPARDSGWSGTPCLCSSLIAPC